jgi:uncharacterized repeat protein (TIGR03803 family)
MLSAVRKLCILVVGVGMFAVGAADAATFTKLHDLDSDDGLSPLLSLIDPAGNVYGGAVWGAAFKIAPDGTFTRFGGFAGQFTGGMSRDADGNVYATDWKGGFYEISAAGDFGEIATVDPGTSLGFCNDRNGNFYATDFRASTVVALSPQGNVVSSHAIPNVPQNSGVSCDAAGNVYGGTGFVDIGDASTVYRIDLRGRVKTLHTFCKGKDPSAVLCRDGAGLDTLPAVDASGNIFGTAEFGGLKGPCRRRDARKLSSGSYIGCGVLFELTAAGDVEILHRFCSVVDPATQYCLDGAYPVADVAIGADGTLYSTTAFGGAQDGGTVWSLAPDGTFSILHDFCAKPACAGGYIGASLLKDGAGTLYGSTVWGGKYGNGTVFKLVP